jgi:hypothetical protein
MTDNGSGRAARKKRSVRLDAAYTYAIVLPLAAGPLEPVEHLCGRVDVVVAPRLGKAVSS